jgi:phosphoribosylanthranilate isomerase
MATVRVKICGITSEQDAQDAVRAGADALGFNFFKESPRYIAEERAAAIIRQLPPFVEPVALFVDEPVERMTATCQRLGPVHAIQCYGQHPLPVASFHFIPAFGVKDANSLADINDYLDRCRNHGALPAAVLLDASVDGMHGGTGKTAPWKLLADFGPGVPIFLAGGLTPDNVAEAIRLVRPYGVDVASGVERSRGQKDADKMRRFVEQAKNAETSKVHGQM